MICSRIISFFALILLVWGEIIKLTEENKNQVFSNSRHTLIFFSKPNCKYCDQFDPIYNQLSELYDNDKDFQLTKIDTGTNKQLKQVFKISSYPKLVLFDRDTSSGKIFNDKRNLINLVNFINDNTNAINHELETNVKFVDNPGDLKLENDLVVLALSYMPTFQDFEYPTHFFQKMSYEYGFNFNIIFIDLIDATEFIRQYKVSNFPSAIFFKTPEKFKVFRTFSSDHEIKAKLGEAGIIEFCGHLNDQSDDRYGHWFDSIVEYDAHLANQLYEFRDGIHYGFNYQARASYEDDEVAYEAMMKKIDL